MVDIDMKKVFILMLIIVLVAYLIYLYEIYSLIKYWTSNTKYIIRYVPNYNNDTLYDKLVITHNNKFTQSDLFKYFNSFTGSRIPGYGNIRNSNNSDNTGNLIGTSKMSDDVINVDGLNHYISFVAMVDPSNNLYTYEFAINLMPNNKWIDQLTVPLYIKTQETPIAYLYVNRM